MHREPDRTALLGFWITLITLILVFGLLICQKAEAGEGSMWSNDTFFRPDGTIQADKLQHFAGNAGLYVGLRVLGGGKRQSAVAVAVISVLWEIKDAIIPYEVYGFWGGDGFSWRDLVAGWVGLGAMMLLEDIISI